MKKVALFLVLIFLSSAAAFALGRNRAIRPENYIRYDYANDNIDNAFNKAQEMIRALDDNPNYAAVVAAGQKAREYIDAAYRENLKDQACSHLSDARDWADQAIKDAKAAEKSECLLHTAKLMKSLDAASRAL